MGSKDSYGARCILVQLGSEHVIPLAVVPFAVYEVAGAALREKSAAA